MFHGSYLRISRRRRRRGPVGAKAVTTSMHADTNTRWAGRYALAEVMAVSSVAHRGQLGVWHRFTFCLLDSHQHPCWQYVNATMGSWWEEDQHQTFLFSFLPDFPLRFLPLVQAPLHLPRLLCTGCQLLHWAGEKGRQREGKVWDEEQQFTSHPAA